MKRGTLTAAVVAAVLSTAPHAAAQFGIRAASAGFTSANPSGSDFGIRVAIGEPVSGFAEGELFKSGSGFVFAHPEVKVPDAVDVEDDIPDVVPERFDLDQNYPNPFNPVTNIVVSIPERSHVRLEVYNTIGQRVSLLVDGEMGAGKHRFTWDATDESGRGVASGTYIYRLVADDFTETRTMTLLK